MIARWEKNKGGAHSRKSIPKIFKELYVNKKCIKYLYLIIIK